MNKLMAKLFPIFAFTSIIGFAIKIIVGIINKR